MRRLNKRSRRQRNFKKAEMADLKHANKLYKEKIAEEKRVAREAAKVEREKEKAEKAAGIAERRAERERQK